MTTNEILKLNDEDVICAFLDMLAEYDTEDLESIDVVTYMDSTEITTPVGFEPLFVEIPLIVHELYFKGTGVKLVIMFAKKEPEDYWKYFIDPADTTKNTNNKFLWAIILYPKSSDRDYFFRCTAKETSIGWRFISKDIEDKVNKMIDSYNKNNKDTVMKKIIFDVIDEFHKKKLSKDIKHNNSISNRSNTNVEGK